MQKLTIGTVFTALIAFSLLVFASCEAGSTGSVPTVAATVNGRDISSEEVERLIKQQARGEEAKMSQMELTQARLQVLESLIQQEVMYQKAEAEKSVPTDEEVNQKFNELKTASGKSAEQFEKEMKDAGENEESLRKSLRRSLAIEALVKKITGKVEAPKESEIEGFFAGNKEQYVKKRGATLAAVIIDPADSGQGDTTRNTEEAISRVKEIASILTSDNFSTIAREKSEDPSSLRGGELGAFSEDDLRKNFGDQYASGFMNPKFVVGGITPPQLFFGKYYFFKLVERTVKNEELTLESPKVREDIISRLTEGRKELVKSSYGLIAMNEARIVNHLAKRVVDNPNELSGARPAGVNSNSNSNSNSSSKTAAANSNSALANSVSNANIEAANNATASNANVK